MQDRVNKSHMSSANVGAGGCVSAAVCVSMHLPLPLSPRPLGPRPRRSLPPQSKLAALAQEAQVAQAAATSYFEWMGARHPVSEEGRGAVEGQGQGQNKGRARATARATAGKGKGRARAGKGRE